MLGAWLSLAHAAHRAVHGGDFLVTQGPTTRRVVDGELVSKLMAEPLKWFDSERASLVAMIQRAGLHGDADACWELTEMASPLFHMGRHYDAWQTVLDTALAVTQQPPHCRGHATILYRLGMLRAVVPEAPVPHRSGFLRRVCRRRSN